MNSVLLHGIRRPNAVVLSSTSFYARAVRLQSSEPEQVAEEEHHTIEGHRGAFSGDKAPPPEAPQRNGSTGAYRANGNAASRLPWENVASKLPPKANHVNGNYGNLEALSRSRAAAAGGLGSAASGPFPWDTLAGAQRPPVSRLNANGAPRAFAGEGAIATASSRESRQQEPRRPPVSQDLSLQSHHPSLQTSRQNSCNRQNNRQAEARLPWERMLDVLPPKAQAGTNGLAQSRASTERIQPSKLEGIVNGLGGPAPHAERSLNSSVGVSGSRQHQVRYIGAVSLLSLYKYYNNNLSSAALHRLKCPISNLYQVLYIPGSAECCLCGLLYLQTLQWTCTCTGACYTTAVLVHCCKL